MSDKMRSRLAVAAVFGAIIALSVWRNSGRAGIGIGAGILSGAAYCLARRLMGD